MNSWRQSVGIVLLLGVLLRLLGAGGELWLDEILSLSAVRSVSSLPEILTQLRSDNNHLLVSAWMFLVQRIESPFCLRALSMIAGLGTLLLTATWPGESPGPHRFFLTFLFSISYMFVLYGSEARGYAPMVFLGLGAVRASAHFLRTGQLRYFFLANGLLVGSILAHASGALWLLVAPLDFLSLQKLKVEEILKSDRWRLFQRRLLLVAPSSIFLAWLSHAFFLHLPEPSGALRSYLEVFVNLLSVGFGGPELSAFNPVLGIAAFLIALGVLTGVLKFVSSEWRKDRGLAIGYFLCVLIVPALILLMLEPRVIYERYFIVPLALSYFLAAQVLARLWANSRRHAVVACGAVFAFAVGNLWRDAELVLFHRGAFAPVLKSLRESELGSSDGEVRVASDQTFRARTMLEYFSAHSTGQAGSEIKIRVVESVREADWYLLGVQDPNFEVPQSLPREGGGKFVLMLSELSAPMSGFRWHLLRAER